MILKQFTQLHEHHIIVPLPTQKLQQIVVWKETLAGKTLTTNVATHTNLPKLYPSPLKLSLLEAGLKFILPNLICSGICQSFPCKGLPLYRWSWCIMDFFLLSATFQTYCPELNVLSRLQDLVSYTDLQHLCCKALINKYSRNLSEQHYTRHEYVDVNAFEITVIHFLYEIKLYYTATKKLNAGLLLQSLLRLFAIILIAFLANYWLTIPAIIIVVAMLLFRHYFLHTSRYVQRLEALGRLSVN